MRPSCLWTTKDTVTLATTVMQARRVRHSMLVAAHALKMIAEVLPYLSASKTRRCARAGWPRAGPDRKFVSRYGAERRLARMGVSGGRRVLVHRSRRHKACASAPQVRTRRDTDPSRALRHTNAHMCCYSSDGRRRGSKCLSAPPSLKILSARG